MAELQAMILALQLFPWEFFNIYTDSQYVAQIIHPLETAAYIAPFSTIYESLIQLQGILWQRENHIFVRHLRAHTPLPGPLNEGNRLADEYTRPCINILTSQAVSKAQSLHRHFHLNAGSLQFIQTLLKTKQFK